MKQVEHIIKQLRNQNFRITKARRSILSLFFRESAPLSAEEIHLMLTRNAVFVDKTTVYREIAFFKKLSIINDVDYGERKKRYELATDHHHHLICKICKTAKKITSPIIEKEINRLEKTLSENSDYSNIKHSLEFFGICNNCR